MTKREIRNQLDSICAVLSDPSASSPDYQVTWTIGRLRELADEIGRALDPDWVDGTLESRVAELERLVASMRRDQVRACQSFTHEQWTQ